MSSLPDPWLDAADIAARLRAPDSRLILILGAESWCARCRDFKPRFENAARADGAADTVWLWLDLEDHAEFIGDFVPDDLPMLMVYRGGELTHAQTLDVEEEGVLALVLNKGGRVEYEKPPEVRARLLADDWAEA